MSYFRWHDAFVYDLTDKTFMYDILRLFIKKHGVNANDSIGLNIFGNISYIWNDCSKDIIDVIFEYKPNITLLYNVYIHNYGHLGFGDHYVFKKFLEQDIDYQHIRRPFSFNDFLYSNFMEFLDKYGLAPGLVDESKYIWLFRNHFYKGITMFELMKHKLLK